MNPITAEKAHAMKTYKKSHFLDSLILHFLVALTFSVVCSYPLWGHSLSSSMKHFCLISLPYMWSYFFNPKCLFVVVNVIVIFVVKESNLISTSSSIEGEIYNEYVERSRSLKRVPTPRQKMRDQIKPVEVELKEESKVENTKAVEEEKEIEEIFEDYKEALEEDEKVEGKDGDVKQDEKIVEKEELVKLAPKIVEEGEKVKEKREEEVGILPTDELNKRVEAFIARVNKQRWIEANSIVCY